MWYIPQHHVTPYVPPRQLTVALGAVRIPLLLGASMASSTNDPSLARYTDKAWAVAFLANVCITFIAVREDSSCRNLEGYLSLYGYEPAVHRGGNILAPLLSCCTASV